MGKVRRRRGHPWASELTDLLDRRLVSTLHLRVCKDRFTAVAAIRSTAGLPPKPDRHYQDQQQDARKEAPERYCEGQGGEEPKRQFSREHLPNSLSQPSRPAGLRDSIDRTFAEGADQTVWLARLHAV